jgi:hypothetical protein
MSETDLLPLATKGGYEPCEECGAAMDPQQRYCVECAARRGNGANPSSRYFASMSRKARRPLTRPPQKANPTSRAAAVAFFALLPIAVALGVVVGRGGSDSSNNDALIQALRKQEAANTAAAPVAAAPTTASGKTKTAKKSEAEKAAEKNGGKAIAQTANGTVHQVTGIKVTKQKTEEDTKLVEENPEQTGDNYIKAQQNLPDVIVVGGSAGSAPAPSNGVEP